MRDVKSRPAERERKADKEEKDVAAYSANSTQFTNYNFPALFIIIFCKQGNLCQTSFTLILGVTEVSHSLL